MPIFSLKFNVFTTNLSSMSTFLNGIVIESAQVDHSLLTISFGHKINGWVI